MFLFNESAVCFHKITAIICISAPACLLLYRRAGRFRPDSDAKIYRMKEYEILQEIMRDAFDKRALLRVRNTTAEHVELIYEMPRRVWQKNYQREEDISDALYALGGTEYVNTVTQSDEISG